MAAGSRTARDTRRVRWSVRDHRHRAIAEKHREVRRRRGTAGSGSWDSSMTDTQYARRGAGRDHAGDRRSRNAHARHQEPAASASIRFGGLADWQNDRLIMGTATGANAVMQSAATAVV